MALSSSVPSIATAPTTKSGMAGSLLPKQKHAILKKIGFTGPVDTNSMNQFMQSTPGAVSLVVKLAEAAKNMKKLNAGGVVSSSYAAGGLVEYKFTLPDGKTIQTSQSNLEQAKAYAIELYKRGNQGKAPNLGIPTEKPASALAYISKDLPIPANTYLGDSNQRKTKFILESKGYKIDGDTVTSAPVMQDTFVPQEQKMEEGTLYVDPGIKPPEDISAITAENVNATASTTSSVDTTTGNENKMAEENTETTKIKNLNDRLTIAKQALFTAQQLLAEEQRQTASVIAEGGVANNSGTDAAQVKVTAAQNKVNELAGELANQSQGSAREKSVLAIADPSSLVEQAAVDKLDPATAGTTIAAGTGEVSGTDPKATISTVDTQAKVDAPAAITAETAAVTKTKADVDKALEDVKAIAGTVSDEAQVIAAQGELSEGAMADAIKVDPEKIKEVVSGERTVTSDELATAQGLDEKAVKANIAEANVPDNIKAAQTSVSPNEIPKAAQILESDMASAKAITDAGLTDDATAVAAKLAKFSVDDQTLVEFKEGKIEAEDTVQGQLASLMLDFDDGTPAWAAGAMRAANAAMTARGLGGSSMAAAAIVQASMESAIPIASADANAFREMKLNNLGRQQQVALSNAAAQQGVEIANFNAEQQTALQNSQNSFALQSQNLSNKQSVVLANAQIKASLQGQNLSNQQQANIAEAARYAEVSNLNLNNRQQGILQDNANEMQVNLANLSAKQQAYIANAQLEAALQGKKIDNKQQVSITNAARFAEANNLTFTAAEQAKIHNSELMKTIGLAELSSEQAATLQNAASIASMDLSNLSNLQQAAVQNAQAFLQMDITNLNNAQQVAIFKGQAVQQSLLSDAAAENAAAQFNASSKNQTNQFMATLKTDVLKFNANQANAIAQFNAGAENAGSQFNTSIKNQREVFNAGNKLVVAQANAVWKQNVETLNTSAQNAANSAFAATTNEFTQGTIDAIWQRERDLMDFAFKGMETAKERGLQLLLADKKYDEAAVARADTEQTYLYANIWKAIWS